MPGLVQSKYFIPVVARLPVQELAVIEADAEDEVKDIPLLLVQFRAHLNILKIEATEPLTTKKKSEFVCRVIFVKFTVPAVL